jgi:hypothetical protein
MSDPNLRPAQLSDDEFGRLTALETELGGTVVAYEADSPYASLDDAQLAALRSIERDLGVRLVAYSG